MNSSRRGVFIMIKQGLLALVIGIGSIVSNAQAYPLIPDPQMTSGDICKTDNPDFKTLRYPERIPYCQRNVTPQTKTEIYRNYNIPEKCRSYYTVDHFIPLSIGGTNRMINLWPEHKKVKSTRPHLEEDVFKQLQAGRITQVEAINEIISVKTTPVATFDIEAAIDDCNN